MKHTKKIISSITIIFISVFTFFNGYNMVKDGNFSYADETTENWQNVTTNAELVEAFRYYCKSRDLTIEGSAADVITSFTTQTFNNVCNGLGIDITALQAHLKKETDGSNVRYLFDSTGITAYNAIFAQFLQDNELEVGDTVNNKQLYSAERFTDLDGFSCNVYILKSDAPGSSGSGYGFNYILEEGTYYKYNTAQLRNNAGSDVTWRFKTGVTINRTVYARDSSYNNYSDLTSFSSSNWNDLNTRIYGFTSNQNITIKKFEGYKAVFKRQGIDNYIFGNICYGYNQDNSVIQCTYNLESYSGTNSQLNIVINNVYLTTNNNTINNNTYEGDTIINNYGTPSEPVVPDPAPTPDYTPAEDWDIQLPDLDIPNWIISGKENKFPFDIPFNVMYALSLLQAEPQAPRLQGTMDFGFTTWQYDLDLSDFDTVAQICRNMQFLAFLTGLMLMTRKLIWG